jgi:competence ComEA-like helix-hairpin-helix protein
MAIISLRAYNREIEEMIENGQNEEAIAHCRYILEHFPKHVDTYRLMGKAFLEEQRLGDAYDVFQRVLSCIPDDFIAHLGMSIVREDEGDLNAALWHMERAFEVQPSNAAVQAELRRLYGRRDGLSPAKIQLTRGALARMSAKSNLNTQAINELRAALADDPSRPDLQVVLARLYLLTGQNLAAIETSNAILKKLPFCLEANRILAQLLPGTERAKDAAIYRTRYEELDPYAAKLSPAAPTTNLVPDGAVSLDRLEYAGPGEVVEEISQPGWASSLGVTLDNKEEIPEWLAGITAASASVEEGPIQNIESDNQAPPDRAGAEELPEEIQPEDMPDWLKEIEQKSAESLSAGGEVEPLPDWLKQTEDEKLEAAEEGVGILPIDSEGEESDIGSEQLIKDVSLGTDKVVMEDFPAIAGDESLSVEGQSSGSPIQPGEGVAMVPVNESEEITPEEDKSDVQEIKSGDQTEPTPGKELDQVTPEWPAASESGESVAEEVPEWLQELGEGLPVAPPIQEPVAFESPLMPAAGAEDSENPPELIPNWLEEASSEAGDQFSGTTPQDSQDIGMPEEEEISKAEVPDWLRQMEEEFLEEVEEPPEEYTEVTPLQLTPEEEPIMSGEIPSWLIEAMEAEESSILMESHPESAPEEIQAVQGDTQPVKISFERAEPVTAPEDRGESLIPDVEEIPKEEFPAILAESEAPAEVELSSELPAMSVEDEAAALAWLESLAARQGALEEELLTEPGDRKEEIPEWVQQDAESEGWKTAAEEAIIPDTEAAVEEIIAEEAFEELEVRSQTDEKEMPEAELETPSVSKEEIEREWISEVEEPIEAEAISETAPEVEEELPAWLRQISHEEEIETQPSWIAIETEVEAEHPPDFEPAKMDINSASLIQLERIPGVGFILAQNIINYRETEGPFESLAELSQVPGFSTELVHDLEDFLTVEVVTEAPPPPSTLPELQGAWEKIASGDIQAAVDEYSELIKQERYLEDVIRDLEEAIALHPVDAVLYQTLGDAFVRANRLQEALDAYDRAEDLLK